MTTLTVTVLKLAPVIGTPIIKPHRNSFNHAHGLPSLLLLLLLLTLSPPPAAAQLPNALSPPQQNQLSGLKFDKSMAIVLVILVVVFFMLGFLSIYTRQCTERAAIRGRLDLAFPVGGSHQRQHGLDPEIIDTFPTFVYSAVKGLKIGPATLECAVCLNEFHDHETLRLIPKCSHVFHSECIDAWLVSHSTCPVCRANLLQADATPFVAVQISDPEGNGSIPVPESGEPSPNRIDNHSPKVSDLVNQNSRPVRSRSTGFRSWFPRSHSTGHSLGEDWERFTLRLPEEVRNQLVSSTLNRTTSCGATFMRESSGRSGYRSVGRSPVGRNYERPDRRFFWTPPFMNRTGSTRSTKASKESNKAKDDVGERSSDRLFAGGEG